MEDRTIEEAASLLWDLWASGAQTTELPVALRPASLDEGWAIQRAIDRHAGPIGGWKLAATSPTGQAMIGVTEPQLGGMYRSMLVPDEARVPATHMGVAEAEFAFRIRGDLPAHGAPFSRAQLVEHIDVALAGIEVPETRLSRFPATGAPQMVADGMCAAWYVVGQPLEIALDDLPGTELVIRRNGEVVDTKHGSDILGDPVDALVWLADALAARGVSLRDGDVVTTGGCAVVNGIAAGDVITASYGGVEAVRALIGE